MAMTWQPGSNAGGLAGYDASYGQLRPEVFKFTSAGTVDLNGITRFQHHVDHDKIPSGAAKRLDGVARMYVEGDDVWRAAEIGRHVSMTMYVVPASSFAPGTIPTPSQIVAQASTGRMFRSSNILQKSLTISGNHTFNINGPDLSVLTVNTKFWVLLLPTAVLPFSNATTDVPLPGINVNTIGRAISIWSNRTPQAPTITSPVDNSLVVAGTVLTLAFNSNDPDAVVGGTGPDYTDLGGVQVQYARKPSPEEPNPEWIDLPFANLAGTELGPGYYIEGHHPTTPAPASYGARWLWSQKTAPLKCGTNTIEAGAGQLPAGEWQIRLRTFDYGHPFPSVVRPGKGSGPKGGQATGNRTPDTMYATNTSPWSEPITIKIQSQCPPPIPLSPINGVAVVYGNTVALTWQYRNTAATPFPQAQRWVEIREAGSSEWWELDNSVTDDNTYVLSANGVEAGKAYEWRVRVKDSDGETSDWSSVARFWVVPAPASGETRPLPSGTTDAATLGVGKHRVFVYRRGGKVRVGELRNLSKVQYRRVRDDISDADIVINDWDVDGGNLLAYLQTWAYEVVIFRDNGYSQDRVWEGPITRIAYEADSVKIHARDVMVYAYRRIIWQAMSDAKNGDTVVGRAARVLQNVFAPDDPNLLPYLMPVMREDDAKQYRSAPAASRTAYEEIDDMASNAGLDYTAIGRSIILWGTKNKIGSLPEFRDEYLGASPIVTEYGMSFANRYAVSDGNGVYGVASRLPVSGNDETYGLVEMLSNSWASDSEENTGTYTQAGLAKVIASFEEYAEQSISSRFPPPVVVRVPDNTSLNPNIPVSIQHLVPGVAIPLRSDKTLRQVRATQKLDSVRVVEEGGKETISVTMSPFNREDSSMEEGDAE